MLSPRHHLMAMLHGQGGTARTTSLTGGDRAALPQGGTLPLLQEQQLFCPTSPSLMVSAQGFPPWVLVFTGSRKFQASEIYALSKSCHILEAIKHVVIKNILISEKIILDLVLDISHGILKL